MNWGKKIIISGLSLLIVIGCITVYNIKNPVIKGLHGGREIIEYNGQNAIVEAFFPDLVEADYLGRTEDKDYKVYAYGDSSNYSLFTLVGSDNTDSFKLVDFTIPTSGEVTKVFMDASIRDGENKVTKNQVDIEMFKKLISYEGDENIYNINNIYTEGTEIHFAYNNCPITLNSNLVGYIAYIDNTWIIVNPEYYNVAKDKYIETSNKADFIGKKINDPELIEWLNQNSTGVAPESYTEKL